MCNDFGNNIPYSDYLAAFSQSRIPVKWPNAAPNLEPRDDIWVVLEHSDWSAWLEQTGNEADLLRALPPGSLRVEQVR